MTTCGHGAGVVRADFSREIGAHLLLDTDRLIAEGLSPEDARAAARRIRQRHAGGNAFGRVSTSDVAGRFRAMRGCFRTLSHAPAFAFAAVVVLAIGIGANTATFSIVDAVLLRRFPIPIPVELVLFSNLPEKQPDALVEHFIPGLHRLPGPQPRL